MRVSLSLRSKMLMFTFGIVAVLMGLSLAVIHRLVATQVQNRVGDDLAKTRIVFEKFIRERAVWLRSQGWVVAEDPRFTATLDIQNPQLDYQATTVLREARRFQGLIGSDLFIVTNQAGRTLARIDVSTAVGADLSGMPTMTRALIGERATGRWNLGGASYHVATVPVRDGGSVLGTLSAGFLEETDEERLLNTLVTTATGERLRSALSSDAGKGAAVLVQEIQRDFDCDLVAVTDRTGRATGLRMSRTSYGDDLSTVPQVQAALNGDDSSRLRVDRGRMVQMVVVPVWSQDRVVGTLSAGFEIDDRLAHDLRDMMHSEVSFLLNDRVVASTWPAEVRKELEQKVSAGHLSGTQTAPSAITIGTETYLSLFGDLEPGRGRERGVYLIQLSLDQAINFLTRIERALLLIGSVVLLAAALISFLGVARIVKPVRALVEGTRRLAAGNLAHRIPIASRDEIGELAASFNDMAGALTKSRDALAESEEQYRDLFDNANDLVYTTDLKRTITSVNKAGLAMLGYSREELIGKSFYDLLSPDDAARAREQDARDLPGTPRAGFEVDILHKDGSKSTFEIVSRWILEGGAPVGKHGIGRDITDRRERERATNRFREQIYQAEKLRALGEMAAGVAHNFNNLLTGVMGYAQLIEMRTDVPPLILTDAQKIVESARRCAAIVRRIQTFGRPIDTTHLIPIDLHQVIRDTVEITRPKWKTAAEREGKTVEIRLELGDILPIQSIGAAWEEILSNLIFNAVDAMPRGGTITIRTYLEEGQGGTDLAPPQSAIRNPQSVVLQVSDTGIGMEEETKRRIFEPFFTTKEPELGTGLGLSTVWGLVQGQRGHIDVETAPGQGTTFTIRIPPVTDLVRPAEEVRGVQAIQGLHILVIDDEPATRDVLPRMLAGHVVDTAARGEEGLEQFSQNTYDVVISDWSMPGMSGLDVAAEVKRLEPTTVMVLMTGWEVRGRASDYSPAIDLLLQKPLEVEKINRIITQAIHLRGGLQRAALRR